MDELLKQSPLAFLYLAALYTAARAIRTFLTPTFATREIWSDHPQYVLRGLVFSYIAVSILMPLIIAILYRTASAATGAPKWLPWTALCVHVLACAWAFFVSFDAIRHPSSSKKRTKYFRALALFIVSTVSAIVIVSRT